MLGQLTSAFAHITDLNFVNDIAWMMKSFYLNRRNKLRATRPVGRTGNPNLPKCLAIAHFTQFRRTLSNYFGICHMTRAPSWFLLFHAYNSDSKLVGSGTRFTFAGKRRYGLLVRSSNFATRVRRLLSSAQTLPFKGQISVAMATSVI